MCDKKSGKNACFRFCDLRKLSLQGGVMNQRRLIPSQQCLRILCRGWVTPFLLRSPLQLLEVGYVFWRSLSRQKEGAGYLSGVGRLSRYHGRCIRIHIWMQPRHILIWIQIQMQSIYHLHMFGLNVPKKYSNLAEVSEWCFPLSYAMPLLLFLCFKV